ncbi:octanoyl-[acyl-carrier-protein]:protein N-octanoyltransferase LIPT2, mitochondrial [Gastrophryne carolinensis]
MTCSAGRPAVRVLRLGLLSYPEALQAQARCARLCAERGEDRLLLLEHRPVYTVGIRHNRYTERDEVRLRGLGADFHRTDRGGLITFHGPGQLVCYPVLSLRRLRTSLRAYVCGLEGAAIGLCRGLGVMAARSPDTGVWVGDRKIAAIGVHCSRHITWHGLALNCNTDLSWFQHIVPCGIEGKGVTSLSAELGRDVPVEETIPPFLEAFREEFGVTLHLSDEREATQALL